MDFLFTAAGLPTGFPCFQKLKNIPNLQSDNREHKIIENVDF